MAKHERQNTAGSIMTRAIGMTYYKVEKVLDQESKKIMGMVSEILEEDAEEVARKVMGEGKDEVKDVVQEEVDWRRRGR